MGPTILGSFCDRPQPTVVRRKQEKVSIVVVVVVVVVGAGREREVFEYVPGAMPHLQCVSWKKASSEATSTSHASAISNPAVTHAPCTAPTIGTLRRSNAPTASYSLSSASPVNTPEAAVRSIPAQKDRPSPRRTTQRTLSSLSSSASAPVRSRSIFRVRAFLALGLLRVTMPITPPMTSSRRSTSTHPDAMSAVPSLLSPLASSGLSLSRAAERARSRETLIFPRDILPFFSWFYPPISLILLCCSKVHIHRAVTPFSAPHP